MHLPNKVWRLFIRTLLKTLSESSNDWYILYFVWKRLPPRSLSIVIIYEQLKYKAFIFYKRMERKCPAKIVDTSKWIRFKRLFLNRNATRFRNPFLCRRCTIAVAIATTKTANQTRGRNRCAHLLYRLFYLFFDRYPYGLGKTSISEFEAHPSWCLHVPRGVSGFVYRRREQQEGKWGHF